MRGICFEDWRMPAFRLMQGIRNYPIEERITPFLEVAGFEPLKRRAETLIAKMKADYHAAQFLPKRHRLELALWKVVHQHRAYGRIPSLYPRREGLDISLYRAFNFIDMLPDVAAQLSPAGLKRLKGRIKTAFTDENDISSLAQEMDVISWLTQHGCAVTCSDFEGDSGGADFIAERMGIEFEVECKAIRPDKGRQIHDYDAIALFKRLQALQERHAEIRSEHGVVVTVRIPGKMPRDPAILKHMEEFITRSVETREGGSSEHCVTDIMTFPISSSPFSGMGVPSDKVSRDFAEGLLGVRNANLVVTAKTGKSALVIYLKSERQDGVVNAIYDSLKHATTQLSGRRPGMVAAVISDVDAASFDVMSEPHVQLALETVIQRLYAGRDHVCAVHIFGELGYGLTRSGYFPAPGQIYSSYNESNASHADPRLDLGQAVPQ